MKSEFAPNWFSGYSLAMTTNKQQNLLTDIPGLLVGNAHDEKIRTGVTVVRCTSPMVCAVDIAGGGPGTRETDALAAENLVDAVDAIVLSGGSVYGLAAADAVVAKLGANGEGFGLSELPGVPKSPIVPAAILYDLANGGDKKWGEQPPYHRLGQAALANISTEFEQGNAGAGYGALAGSIKGGLGSFSIQSDAGFRVAALVAVNCFGSVMMPGSTRLWAEPFMQDGQNAPTTSFELQDWGAAKINPGARQNTTLAIVATDLPLTPAQAKRMAKMAQAGLARAIRPIAAPFDGDVIFALAKNQPENQAVNALLLAQIGALAADTLTRAVGRAISCATTLGPHLSWAEYVHQKS
ncbi:ENDO-TYPE 6-AMINOHEXANOATE OLIGOMER HYDROLASE [hydrothermal vent metagenome]|uniref:ENDO-TYPE 6-AMINOHEXANOATE OLIGOMER HYDROLASE n=1 Tax=hydrothermal vent metagenome TaxID=652676 RepID=A0A3B0RPV0_9ZZZZ